MKTLFLIILTFFALSLFAQEADNSIQREGFVIGFGVGGGVISISDSNQEVPFDKARGGISFPNLKLGWMLNNRLAILGTFPGMIYKYEGKDRSFDAIIPSVQYWVKDRWWINGGFGLAIDGPALYKDLDDESWNFGYAVTASTGYELIQKKKFALDLQTNLQLGRVFMDNDEHRDGVAFSVGLGFNWY